jgi:asparagine synthase (glutamine-hydrolysing)
VCGIIAIWSPAGGLCSADVAAAVRCLRHRGPDGSGTWASASGRAVLGHTRLAVIDLATGGQPITAGQGRFHLIHSGEFYGYEKIRAELQSGGRRLVTRGDSEIALHLYAANGPEALARLRGEFAFIIWDDERRELFAARDRFGVKPLFYAEHQGRLYLASEVKALLSCGITARWDEASFADHLLISHAADRTLFAGVRQVPPGCYLRAAGDGITVSRYWDLDYPRADELPSAPEAGAHLADVAAAVRESVQLRMRADVPVACHLSGGIDSSSIAAIAAEAGPVPTFTVCFDGEGFDESAMAGRTAARLGGRHEVVAVTRADFARYADQAAASGEMIQENSHGIARLLLSAAIRDRGYKVVLAGEGGDEMFAGYPQFGKDLALARSAQARARADRSYASLAGHGVPPHLRLFLDQLGFVPNWILDRYLAVTQPLLPLLRPEFARRVAGRPPSAGLLASPRLRGRSLYHQSVYLFCKSWLCNYILAAERLDMAHAVETRLPFLDHHVFDVARWTPLDWYERDGVSKAVLREAMAAYLPAEVRRAPKKGFFAPAAAQDAAALARFSRIVAGDALRQQPFFEPARVARFAADLRAMPPARRERHDKLVQIISGTCLLADSLGISGA